MSRGQPSTSTLSTTPRGRRDGSPSRIRRTATGAGSLSPTDVPWVEEHIEAYSLGADDLLFPQWMFAYLRSSPVPADDDEHLPPLVSKAGIVYEHGTKGARYSMNCHCGKCKAYAADYQRQWRRQQSAQRASTGEPGKASSWRRDGTEFLMAEVWLRLWNAARDAAGLPEGFTPYNARHTGISWAIDKGVDLQKVRQRAGQAASRSRPGTLRSSMSATPASRMPLKRSSTARILP